MRVVLISQVLPAVLGYSLVPAAASGTSRWRSSALARAAERYWELDEILAQAPTELDVVMPATPRRTSPRCFGVYEPDLALCAGFPWKIPADAIEVPRHGIVNGHPSLLPRYRGPSPVSWAIRNGEPEVGFTFHYMDAELDTGGILAQARIPLGDEHSWEELEPTMVEAITGMFPRVLERVERGDPGDPQSEADGTYYSFFEPEYAWIDVSRVVRGGRSTGARVAVPLAGLGRARSAARAGRREGARAPGRPRAGGRPAARVRGRHTVDRGRGGRMRPVIGITTYAQDARWGVWHLPAALIPLDYVDAVERAGGRPVLIPPSEEGVEETLDDARRNRVLRRRRRRSRRSTAPTPTPRRTSPRRGATAASSRSSRRRSSAMCRCSPCAAASSC